MPEIQKVTDPTKKPNAHLASLLVKQGMDKDYVELWHDYAPRSRGKEYSPYARFYKDRKSNKRVMVVSILPHCTADGRKIECGWLFAGGKYYSKANLFSAIVDGKQIQVTALSDQPHGAKKNDRVTWQPQLFLNGIEQTCGEATLLTTDPINAGYFENTIEWDYGICKRRIRIIEGRIREKWLFAENPNGEVRIKHNHTGNYRLRLLTCKINDDEELIPAPVFDEAEYPLEVMASPETFYPDPHVEDTSVDGQVTHKGSQLAWATIVAGVGTEANDTAASAGYVLFYSDPTSGWNELSRAICLFNTDGLPNDVNVTGVVLSIYGSDKADGNSCAPAINVYSSDPASNVALVGGDFDSLGTEALASAIAHAAFNIAGYNNFTLIDVNSDNFATNADGTYINKEGVTKLGLRDSLYDVTGDDPNRVGGQYTYLSAYFADQGGTTRDPKLVVTYELPAVGIENKSANMGAKMIAGKLI